jgi:hypothetical protein
MSDYTPTTDYIRTKYIISTKKYGSPEMANAEFDRWLAAHDLEVANEVKASMSKCSCTWTVGRVDGEQ